MDMHFYLFKFMYIRTYIICNCAGTWAEIRDVIGCSQKKPWSLPRSTASCTRRLFSACRVFQSTEAVPGRWHVPMPWCSWQNWKVQGCNDNGTSAACAMESKGISTSTGLVWQPIQRTWAPALAIGFVSVAPCPQVAAGEVAASGSCLRNSWNTFPLTIGRNYMETTIPIAWN